MMYLIHRLLHLVLIAVTVVTGGTGRRTTAADFRILDPDMHHIRSGEDREWSEFPETAEAQQYTIEFEATANDTSATLRLRQRDVKQSWTITLNGDRIGRLVRDENHLVEYWGLPAGALVDGTNSLLISQAGGDSDDIEVGDVAIDPRPLQAVRSATVSLTILHDKTNTPVPCRITIIDQHGAIHSVDATSNDHMAVRQGVIYCRGRAQFGVAPGKYTIHASRGFEYSLSSVNVEIAEGDRQDVLLTLRQEVPTPGYVACDTHVHTFTHSRHGDATIEERMLTLAGEGIELPIATDHNLHISYDETARAMHVREFFTPVIGNEVTSPDKGHFNIFPIRDGAGLPNHKADDWPGLFDSIFGTPDVKIAILNHARDVHGGYRPFDPQHHLALTGRNLDGWKLRANAMEIINSGAQQTDMMQLVRDWFGLLNAGMSITPVGSSDSHDVSRFIVGQGRTYIRCEDSDPGHINVDEAATAFAEGRVIVSCGLMPMLTVNNTFGPGDLVPKSDRYTIDARVHGPAWSETHRVGLYANGVLIREEHMLARNAGMHWSGSWEPGEFEHDVFLSLVATGPGTRELFWPMAKPYQPDSIDWTPLNMGITGTVWIDGDGDGVRTSAREYAESICRESDFESPVILARLRRYDQAVAAQAADILYQRDPDAYRATTLPAARSAGGTVHAGFEAFDEAIRKSNRARALAP